MPSALILDAWLPTPDRDAASFRLVNLMRILRGLSWRVTLGADDRSLIRPDSLELLDDLGVAFAGDSQTSVADYLKTQGSEFDLVILSRFHVAAKYIEQVRQHASRARVVFDTTDLAFLRGFRGAKVTGNRSLLVQAMQAKRDELAVARQADCTWVVSPVERAVLQDECPGIDVRILSLIHETVGEARSFGERRDVLFVGAFPHHPNVDGMRYFVDDIFPLLEGRLDNARTFVVGVNPPPWLQALASERLAVTGYVPDLVAHLDRCRLTIAPLRYGAGVKGKVILSMSYGVPVVATSVAAEGIPATPGCDILIGDDPRSFADEMERLYHDESLWGRLSEGGLRVVEEHYSFAAARARLLDTLDALGFEQHNGDAVAK